ncbi:MAG: Mur ligase family protein [Candidatus Eiseniibacteriota bacterium]
MKLGLDRFRAMLRDLDHPERRLATVLVAGTNGKGSVAAILARLLEATGYRTGLSTSPHLLGYRERVRVDGRAIDRTGVARCMRELAPVLERHGGSFFEAMTGLALVHFVRQAVDIAVFEVGLGGRLDATNVGRPEVSVVVGIALDHTRILGPTIERIACEKVAIARRGRPLVIGARGRARAVLEREARARGARPLTLGRDAHYRTLEVGTDGSELTYSGRHLGHVRARLALPGRHQVRNAAVALLAAECLVARGWQLGNVERALATVRWPGRLEYLPRTDRARGTGLDGGQRPALLLDGAHNPDGARALARYLDEVYRDGGQAGSRLAVHRHRNGPGRRRNGHGQRRIVAVVGMLERSDLRRFLGDLRPLVDDWVLTRPPGERGMNPVDVATALDRPALIEPDVARALARAERRAGPEGLVCVCGSLRTIGAAMRARGRRRIERL